MDKPGFHLPFGIPRDLAVLGVSMLFWGLGEGLFIYFLPLSLQRWTSDPVLIGTILSLIGVAMALVQVPSGYLSDRIGPRPLMRAALILGVFGALVMAAAQSMSIFTIGLITYCMTSFIGAPINSYITRKRGRWSVQRAVTFVSGCLQLGAIAGPLLGGTIGQAAGLSAVFLYSAGLFLVATVILFFARRPAARDNQESAVIKVSPFANRRFWGLLAVVFFTIVTLSTPQQLTSLYLQDLHHLSLQQIGVTGTLAGLGTAAILFALGHLRPSTGMLAGQLLVGLFSLLMWQGQSVWVFYTGYLFAGGYRLYRSMALAAARPLVKEQDVGVAYSLIETGNALAMIVAPTAAGLLYNYRPEAVYTASLGALAITILLNMRLHSRGKPLPFTPGEPQFWTDPHIARQMLKLHLDPTTDAASRRPEVIDRTTAWIVQALILKPGDRLIDLGCGPGLYTLRLARQGLQVTGVDFSQNSIDYAVEAARQAGLEITYRCQDYLTLTDEAQYDAALLIYGDFCPLSPEQRARLLSNVRRALKPGGYFVLDVSTPHLRRREGLKSRWYAAAQGFWKPGPHLVREQGFAYPGDIYLDQYTVIEPIGRVTVYRNWFQDYTPETIRAELVAGGFEVESLWSDLAGAAYHPGSDWIGVVAKKTT